MRAYLALSALAWAVPFASAAAISPIVSNGRGWDVLLSIHGDCSQRSNLGHFSFLGQQIRLYTKDGKTLQKDESASQPWIEIVASKIIDPEKGERGTVMLILLEAVIVGPSSFMPDWPFDGTCCQAKTSYRLRINLETGSVRNTNTLTYRSCKSESGMTPDQRFPACPKSYVPEPPFVAFCDWAARSMQYLTWPVYGDTS